MDGLKTLLTSYRKLDTRLTNDNKKSMINEMNKYAKDYGYSKLKPTATFSEVQRTKTIYKEELGYAAVSEAVKQGNTVVAEVYGRDLRKSQDHGISKLGEYAKDLAGSKKVAMRKLSPKDLEFLDKANFNIKGFGNKDMISEFEKTQNKDQIQKLINDVKTENAKQIYYDKTIGTFEKTFVKVGITRAEDIEKLKAAMAEMPMDKLEEHYNYLMKTLDELYPTNGAHYASEDNDTELANTRLDDMMIRLGLNKGGIRKVNSSLKNRRNKIVETFKKR